MSTRLFIIALSFFSTKSVLAATFADISSRILSSLFNPLAALLFSSALLAFLWGLVKYISSVDNEESQKKARNMMIWGIISLFVMASVWGLSEMVVKSFFQNYENPPESTSLFSFND